MRDATKYLSDDLIFTLTAEADAADAGPGWPERSWAALCDAGVTGWSVPTEFGGRELDGVALLNGYESIASACLTTAFILSQRDAAVRRVRDFAGPEVRHELLRPLACGGRFATVGISQLTTSRQYGGERALRATPTADGFVLDGVMPWVTGADQANHLVVGATLDDGLQILVVVPADAPGLHVEPPLPLMALTGSRTTLVRCDGVAVPRRWLLAGPVEKVMATGRGGTGGLETSCLALGLAGAAIDWLRNEATTRPEWTSLVERYEVVRGEVRATMHQLATSGGTAEQAVELRAKANALVLRSTQAALTASKGAGFVPPHPAQRWARQAMFFLVWSCPRPAVEATMEYLNPT